MKTSTGDDGIKTIDVQEDEELCVALGCSECGKEFPWVAKYLPNFCPMCGHAGNTDKVIAPKFVEVWRTSGDA